jgi:hypothetical protein
MFGIVPVRKPCKGCPVRALGLRPRENPAGSSECRLILRGAASPRFRVRVGQSAWEESGRNPGSGTRRKTLRGQSPREQPAVGRLTPVRSPGTPGRVKAQKPRPVGPALRFGGGITDGKNGMWVHSRGNAASTFREEKAPQGESQERRRCETKPAGARRAKTAARVTKP